MPLEYPVDEFFNSSDFAQDAIYISPDPAIADQRISIIFVRPYEPLDLATGIIVQNAQPLAYCRAVDVADADKRARLTVNDIPYKIAEVQPDSTGITILVLTRD